MSIFGGPHSAEINQLNAQIKTENGKISGYQYTLGTLLLKKLEEGYVMDDPVIMEQYAMVKASRESIAGCTEKLQELQKLIAEEEAQKAAEKERKQAEAATLRAARAAELAAKTNALFNRKQTAAAGAVCPSCGNAVAPGMLFCNKCGTKLAEPAPAPAAVCPECGNPLSEGMLFCNKCGHKLS